MYRRRSRIGSSRRVDCSGGLPGFGGNSQLNVYPEFSTNNKADSPFQEDLMPSLWSDAKHMERVLLWTLRY
ncbi:hypothetical protein, partial [Polaromonas sp.]|uniref:hypothetical protein n=1 Tax=Polaromonas sp. TaxID=1869339 RepID=UPI00286B2FA4